MFLRFLFLTGLVSLFFGSAHAACYSSGVDWTGKSTVVCDDGNNYSVNRNRLMGTTSLQGYNANTGSTWSSQSTNNIFGKSQSGVDRRGNRYNCTLVFGRWSC